MKLYVEYSEAAISHGNVPSVDLQWSARIISKQPLLPQGLLPEPYQRHILETNSQNLQTSLLDVTTSPKVLRKNWIKFVSTATNVASWKQRKLKDKDIQALPREHMLF